MRHEEHDDGPHGDAERGRQPALHRPEQEAAGQGHDQGAGDGEGHHGPVERHIEQEALHRMALHEPLQHRPPRLQVGEGDMLPDPAGQDRAQDRQHQQEGEKMKQAAAAGMRASSGRPRPRCRSCGHPVHGADNHGGAADASAEAVSPSAPLGFDAGAADGAASAGRSKRRWVARSAG